MNNVEGYLACKFPYFEKIGEITAKMQVTDGNFWIFHYIFKNMLIYILHVFQNC